ncbi:FCD domain-containing protein [Cupriavidus sp. TMH.W2]|uniref:FCD domain-containing protein n=1 Tax=Cupriavidus sp. TMH.W2 TaxID=3434465 RepID=UPI003D76D77B
MDALRESVRHGDDAWERRVRESFEALSAWEQPVRAEHRAAWEACNRRYHEALISAAATSWTYLVLRMLSQQGERYRRVCIGLETRTHRDVHAEHLCIFDAAMRRADARAALALEDHISMTLAIVRSVPAGTLPFC